MSGNLPVVRELIDSKGVDVQARVRVDLHEFGAEKGWTRWHSPRLAVLNATCTMSSPRCSRLERIRMLRLQMERHRSFAAVGYQNLGGVCALLACDKVDLEKGLSVNRASPLNIAGYLSTFEILKALVDAGANRAYRCEQRPWE